MADTTISVANFAELHEALTPFKSDKRWIFRGHASETWTLQPRAGRPPFDEVADEPVFEAWKRRAIEYVSKMPQADWDWLAIAQHHGLATRYLDWTTNPLNAAFFAVREKLPGDATIYAVQFRRTVRPKKHPSPFDFEGIGLFYPSGFVPRITRQGGLFTIHGPATGDVDKKHDDVRSFKRITIVEKYREELRSDLAYYGVSDLSLFPDLDGLSQFVNWTIEAREYFRVPSEQLFE